MLRIGMANKDVFPLLLDALENEKQMYSISNYGVSGISLYT